MFSQLGPLFKTTFRQAESNDTRQHIPHEEKDKGRKKREEIEKQESQESVWEDNMAVTVSALRAFLINFLSTLSKEQGIDIEQGINKIEPASTRPPEKSRPTSTKNAKAVRAYQSMAAQSTQNTENTSQQPSRKLRDADLLESKELRDIYQLIDDLDELEHKGIQNLSIRKADSFVESLKDAVRLIQSKL